MLLPSGSKSRKVKSPESSKDLDYSDRGDSDMDEDTYSSSQEQQVLKVKCAGLTKSILLQWCSHVFVVI